MSKRRLPKLILPYLIVFCLATLLNAQEETSEEQEGETQTMPTIYHEVLLDGTYSGIREPLQKVITNKEEWQELWKKHVSVIVPQPPVPEVDFDNFVVAAIFAGEKNTSGYQVKVKEVLPVGNNVNVRYRLVEPPANSFTLQVIVQPFVLLKVQKPTGTVQLIQ
jgi:PrcB C-terminal